MNNDWKEFDKKRLKLHKKYKRLKWKPRIIWILYNILADIIIFCFLTGRSFPFAVFTCFFSTVLSTVYLIKAINELSRIEAEQDRILMNDAPVGKLKL